MPDVQPRWNPPIVRCAGVFIVLAVTIAPAQEAAPKGVVRGKLVTVQDSDISLKTSTGAFLRCSLDRNTYIERDGQRVFAGALRAGDPLELITDLKAGDCYTRTIRIVNNSARLLNIRPNRTTLDNVFPRGNLTFSGVIRRLGNNMLVLRTRTEEEQVVLLRDDTRFLDSGLPADASTLAVNTRVFIRGGRNLENDLEAYQVIWGEIVGPKSSR